MNQDTVQINEVLCVLKRYYDKDPETAPVLYREDTAYRVQKLVDTLEELEKKEELEKIEELRGVIGELREEIESLEEEIEDLQEELE